MSRSATRSFLFVVCLAQGCAPTVFDQDEDVAASAQTLGTKLEVEQGTRTGTLDRAFGAVMDSAGDKVCWKGVNMMGVSSASVRYSNGEGAGDRLGLTYNDAPIGSFALPHCSEGGAWQGDCGDASAEFTAQSGSGTLCLVGVGPGWIGALDSLVIAGACGSGPCEGPSDAFVIRANRSQRYVVLSSSGFLEWRGTNPATAEVFERVEPAGARFKLRARSTGRFVGIDGSDSLLANATRAAAAQLEAPPCTGAFVGLRVVADTDGANFVATEDSGRMQARTDSCRPNDANAWEKFELIPVSSDPAEPDPEPEPDAPVDGASGIVPLFGQQTALEPAVLLDTPSALITRFADRGRDRHARESSFASYEHYLTWYWEDRTAAVTVTDPIGKGGSEIRFDVVTRHKLGARELRMGFLGRHTVAEYCDNSPLVPAHPDGREMSVAEHEASAPEGPHHYFKIVRQHSAPISCATSPLARGQKIEFEMSQFLDRPRNGRSNYYGTTFLYVVGEGIKAWEATGPLGNSNPAGLYGTSADSMPIPDAALLGGKTTTHRNASGEPDNLFMQMATNLAPQNGQRFVQGRRLMHTDFAGGAHDEPGNPSWTEQAGKAGPLLINRTCNSCHARNSRALPAAPGQPLDKWVFKVSDAAGNPDPRLGSVLQIASTAGAGEGSVSIGSYAQSSGLSRPNFVFSGMAPARFSARISPQLVGMGLLEAIPESAIMALADPSDANGDGISGRVREVKDVRGVVRLGRFGWKASQPDLRQQVAAALRTDMGVLSSVFPAPDCGAQQASCGGNGAELSDTDLGDLTVYMSLLGVQPQDNHQDPQVREGAALFSAVGCASCHTQTFRTSQFAAFAELRTQTIHPYTDLLLHDMGPGLADNLSEGNASGAEWRTAPLWGIGKTRDMHGGQEAYLHDGRARTLEEAIRWHGGEAQAANDRFAAGSTTERAALLAFLRSL